MPKRSTKGLPVTFGTMSLQKTVISAKMSWQRSDLNLDDSDNLLRQSQLGLSITVDPEAGGESKTQGKMFDTAVKLEAVVDTGTLHVKKEEIATNVQFKEDSVELEKLKLCRCRAATLNIRRMGESEQRGRPTLAAAE